MSFRQFGGIQYAPKHNIVSSNYNTSNNLQVTQVIGQPNSYINVESDISGNIKMFGNVDISGNLTVRENVGIAGDLGVSGDTDISGNLLVQQDANIAGDLGVSGDTDISGNLLVQQDANIAGDLGVSGTTQLNGNVGIGKAPSTYALDVSGNTNIIGSLNVTNGSTYLSTQIGNIYMGNGSNVYVSVGSLNASQYNLQLGLALTSAKYPNYSSPYNYLTCAILDNTYAYIQSWRYNSSVSYPVYPLLLNPNGGTVGIGKTSTNSLYNLDVSGNINLTGTLYQNGSPYTFPGTTQWTTSGSNIYYKTGNVGIGTNNPYYPLDVSGNANVKGNATINGNAFITTNYGSTSTSTLTIEDFTGNSSTTKFMYFLPNSMDNIYNNIVNSGDSVISTSNSPLVLTKSNQNDTNGIRFDTDQITIGYGGTSNTPSNNIVTNANNVIITSTSGTTCSMAYNNSQKNYGFKVQDTVTNDILGMYAYANNNWDNNLVNSGDKAIVAYGTTNAESLVLTTLSTTTSGVRISANDVLLGAGGSSDTPTNNIDINGSTNTTTFSGTTLNINNTNVNFSSSIRSSGLTIYESANANNICTLNIDSSGNTVLTTNNSGSNTIYLNTNNANRVTINSSGLTVSGQVTATSFQASSDYRLKSNITTINPSYTIDHLHPVEYEMNHRHEMGFLAHELQEHYPFLVDGEKDGDKMQSINYIGLISLLVKEVQTLKSELSFLKKTAYGAKCEDLIN